MTKYSKFICTFQIQNRNKYQIYHNSTIIYHHKVRKREGKKKVTSLKAPMRDKTLLSFFIWATNSWETGELKKTNALVAENKVDNREISPITFAAVAADTRKM